MDTETLKTCFGGVFWGGGVKRGCFGGGGKRGKLGCFGGGGGGTLNTAKKGSFWPS